MLHIADTITREVLLPAPPSEVWRRSIGTGEALSSWFPQKVVGEFALGAKVHFVWGEHKSEILITQYVPDKILAYKWHPGDAVELDAFPENELTEVVFTLEPHEAGTLVKVVETGFSNIPEPRGSYALGQNSGGWDEELAKLPLSYKE